MVIAKYDNNKVSYHSILANGHIWLNSFASGWGKNLWGKEGKYQVILKKIDLPIISRSPCQERLRRTRLGYRFNLHRSFICAGKSNHLYCNLNTTIYFHFFLFITIFIYQNNQLRCPCTIHRKIVQINHLAKVVSVAKTLAKGMEVHL